MRRGILERDAELSVLTRAVREAADRHGSVELVKGEAGISGWRADGRARRSALAVKD